MTAGLPDPAAVAAALAEADRIGREQANAAALANWHARGEFDRGYQQALTDQQAEATQTARHLAADVGLMERRWGPGGRENFGAPRPGDFPGTDCAFRRPGTRPPVHQPHRQAEPDIDREAG
jgi:2-polyprenyl-6-methoxyphenol hydroxylase-like FAD-dependent oxidoreductase